MPFIFFVLLLVSCIEQSNKPSADTGSTPIDTDSTPVDQDNDGVLSDLDCNDHDPAIFPGADEFCDEVDHDCDGLPYANATDSVSWYADTDGDGYGSVDSTAEACEPPAGHVALSGDCDDTSPAFHPGAVEWDCTDPTDYNCDGSVQYQDEDGDGHPACEDCDDSQVNVNPDADEICDATDNDCNGGIDDDAVDALSWYADSDGDGFGGTIFEATSCEPPAGFVLDNTDCNDLDPSTYPSAAESCDEADNDCDGTIDEGVEFTWYADSDGDGYGDYSSTEQACAPSPSYTPNANDCDDNDPATNPSAYEICDSVDNNCDGVIDEASAIDAAPWYPDADSDGYGDASVAPTDSCTSLSGFVENNSDCDDGDSGTNPQGQETCSGTDNDCDGLIDEADPSLDSSSQGLFYTDEDGDGYGGSTTVTACNAPSGSTSTSTDCNDSDASINPAAVEVPGDGIDNDCANDLPTVDVVILSPTTVYTNDILTAAVSTSDSDGDTVTLSYAWSVDNSVVLQGVDEASLAGTSFFSKGQSVSVSVTPDDGFGTGASASSNSLTVLNTAPTGVGLTLSPASPRSGIDEVTCLVDSEATDADSDLITYIFSWQLNGSPWNGTTANTVHSGDTILDSDTSTDQVWTCEAVAYDGTATGPSSSVEITIVVADTDGDGVYDDEDLCPGFDDFNDANGNTLPDDCEQSTGFTYTGAPQTFTVPSNVTLMHIECWGAAGWTGNNNGGQGGLAEGLLTVSPSDELYVYVGGQGTASIGAYNPQGGGWNGGGDGQNNGSGQSVGGGGGASDVRLVYSTNPLDSTSLSSRLVVGAGGGGSTNNTGASGGHGGGLEGTAGGQHGGNHQATGGTQSAAGSANAGFGYGGSGNGSMTPWNGGGGSGWYGGGTSTAHSGGAGGSSYVGGLDGGTVSTAGQSGNGSVVISWSQP